MPSTTTATTATVSASRFRAIAAYLAFRAIPLDPHDVLSHFERIGITEDLFAVEGDYFALLDRFAERVCGDLPGLFMETELASAPATAAG